MSTYITPPSPTLPTATLAPTPTTTSRRLPPPCWSPEETVALIKTYQSKWYSLRRGNLRANHWQEVADHVSSLFPSSVKTAVQCRHKMEKLRKRYRNELQRAVAFPGGVSRYSSSWVHFISMYEMENGPTSMHNHINVNGNKTRSPPSSSDEDEEGYDNNNNRGSGNCVRIKIPGQGSVPTSYYNPRFVNSIAVPNVVTNVGGGNGKGVVMRDDRMGKRVAVEMMKEGNGDGGMGEIVAAIRGMGEGFMRIEKAKMDMVRQVEEMRMEMELKRTEMILESQQRIVDAFAKAITERRGGNKRVKRMADLGAES